MRLFDTGSVWLGSKECKYLGIVGVRYLRVRAWVTSLYTMILTFTPRAAAAWSIRSSRYPSFRDGGLRRYNSGESHPESCVSVTVVFVVRRNQNLQSRIQIEWVARSKAIETAHM